MARYRKSEVARLTGQSLRTIQYYVDLGLVVPEVRTGRGAAMVFSEKNLIEFSMIRIMREEFNMSLFALRGLFKRFRRDEARGWYTDFFTNPIWGRERDLVFIQVDQRKKGGVVCTPTIHALEPVNAEYEFLDEDTRMAKFFQTGGAVIMLPLGRIRNEALERLNL